MGVVALKRVKTGAFAQVHGCNLSKKASEAGVRRTRLLFPCYLSMYPRPLERKRGLQINLLLHKK